MSQTAHFVWLRKSFIVESSGVWIPFLLRRRYIASMMLDAFPTIKQNFRSVTKAGTTRDPSSQASPTSSVQILSDMLIAETFVSNILVTPNIRFFFFSKIYLFTLSQLKSRRSSITGKTIFYKMVNELICCLLFQINRKLSFSKFICPSENFGVPERQHKKYNVFSQAWIKCQDFCISVWINIGQMTLQRLFNTECLLVIVASRGHSGSNLFTPSRFGNTLKSWNMINLPRKRSVRGGY